MAKSKARILPSQMVRKENNGLISGDAHVSRGVTEGDATCLGEHKSVGVADSGILEVGRLSSERDVAILLDILGVDYDATSWHATLIENLA